MGGHFPRLFLFQGPLVTGTETSGPRTLGSKCLPCQTVEEVHEGRVGGHNSRVGRKCLHKPFSHEICGGIDISTTQKSPARTTPTNTRFQTKFGSKLAVSTRVAQKRFTKPTCTKKVAFAKRVPPNPKSSENLERKESVSRTEKNQICADHYPHRGTTTAQGVQGSFVTDAPARKMSAGNGAEDSIQSRVVTGFFFF